MVHVLYLILSLIPYINTPNSFESRRMLDDLAPLPWLLCCCGQAGGGGGCHQRVLGLCLGRVQPDRAERVRLPPSAPLRPQVHAAGELHGGAAGRVQRESKDRVFLAGYVGAAAEGEVQYHAPLVEHCVWLLHVSVGHRQVCMWMCTLHTCSPPCTCCTLLSTGRLCGPKQPW